jgi:UDP-N-acetylmuramyl pentapeptide synthase
MKRLLTFFAHKILAKYRPFVIGITGSVGKTSTRHAISAALSTKYNVREPVRNYNTEFGILLTLFNTEGLEKTHHPLGWLRVIAKGLSVWLLPQNFPKVLVLEYGVDHPKDMDALLHIVKPNVAVMTTISVNHKEYFKTNEAIAAEKGKLVEALSSKGMFVYNIDDFHVAEQAKKTSAPNLSFGTKEGGKNPTVVLEKIEETLAMPASTTLYVKTPTRQLEVTVPVLGTGHVKAVLAAVAVAEALEIETEHILSGLASYRPVPGRLSVLAGIKRSIVIDDTYNAGPLSMAAALELLARFPNPVKVAVLGDMLELGDETDSAHAEIGQLAAKLNLQKLVAVGELGKKIAEAAGAAGMPSENIQTFPNSDDAKQQVLAELQEGSVILVKGSQGARMEKITKELLAEPMSASHVLPRQYGKWLQQ